MQLLPAQYVRAYVKRNKTDRADAAALLEAMRCADICPVPVKTLEQQQVLGLHRLRSQWMSTRQRYVNTLRGILREFGIVIAPGVRAAKCQIAQQLAQSPSELPPGIRPLLTQMLEQIADLERHVEQVERQLTGVAPLLETDFSSG